MVWFLLPAALAVISCIIVHALGVYIARRFIYPRRKTLDETYAMSLESGDFTEGQFAAYSFIPFSLTSPFGYSLEGVRLDPQKGHAKGIVILCHGHRYTWHGTVKFMDIFRNLGFAVIAYNHRFHGSSGGENCTAGYYEKWDLEAVAQWGESQYPDASWIGVMGESMGGAVVLEYLALAQRIDFVIADSPYSSMEDIYRVQMGKHRIPRLLQRAILWRADRYLRKEAGFSLYQVSPKDTALGSPVPLLLIHGADDTFVPQEMSRQIFEQRKDNFPTEIYYPAGADHGETWAVDPQAYRKQVTAFIHSVTAVSHR